MATNTQHPMQFTGTGTEYFRIWIVNIALSLVTLGIYSAWAKVRTKRWFYGHTLIDQQAFAYHALPSRILKGRLIALCFFAAYLFIVEYAQKWVPAMLLILGFASPWIIIKSLKFDAVNSSYRGIHFDFTGRVSHVIKFFALYPLLTLATLGLAYPYVVYKQTQFILNHYHYGKTPLSANITAQQFWKLYGVALLLFIVPVSLMTYGLVAVDTLQHAGVSNYTHSQKANLFTGFSVLSFYLMLPILKAYFKANLANITYNTCQIGTIRFISTQRARDLTCIYISNIALLFLTFGLFTPWAKVRVMHYQAKHLLLESPEDLEEFAASVKQQVTATGGELADVFDFDFAII